ncbi:MAG: hypothetical protein J6S67_07775 [Methanobrevibacter sp.]|nr:hypothetical protein [Methanobrevibacter sp.]
MSFRGFARSEIDIFRKSINELIKDMNENPDKYDADTIGDEYIYAEKTLNLLDHLETFTRDVLPSNISKEDLEFLSGCIDNIAHGYPLSDLNSYEDNPDEWIEYKSFIFVNSRYQYLYKRRIDVNNLEEKKVVTKDIYSDFNRYQLYNIIDNNYISIEDTGVALQLHQMLDQMIPITFPYNPKNERIKLFIELFKGSKESPETKTLSLTHFVVGDSKECTRIMEFFDITKGVLYNLSLEDYKERRQWYEKNRNDSHENNTL